MAISDENFKVQATADRAPSSFHPSTAIQSPHGASKRNLRIVQGPPRLNQIRRDDGAVVRVSVGDACRNCGRPPFHAVTATLEHKFDST